MTKIQHSSKDSITSGPYSPAIEIDNFVFISGQGTYDPKTGQKYLGDISRQTQLAMENLKRIIESCGLNMNNVIKATIFCTEDRYMNPIFKVIRGYFSKDHYPALTTVVMDSLPGGMGIEIEAIVAKS